FDSKSRFPADDILVRIGGKITIEEVIDIRRDAPGFVHVHRAGKWIGRRLSIDPGVHAYQTIGGRGPSQVFVQHRQAWIGGISRLEIHLGYYHEGTVGTCESQAVYLAC